MNDKTINIVTMNLVIVLLLIRFGKIIFWYFAVIAIMGLWFLVIFDSFFHIILTEMSFERYTQLKRKAFKPFYIATDFFEVNLRACNKSNVSEKTGFIMMLTLFPVAIYLLFILHRS